MTVKTIPANDYFVIAELGTQLSFDKNGKQKASKVVSGKLTTVSKNQIAIELLTKQGNAQKVEVYNSSLQRSFQYTFPKGAGVSFYTAFALDEGTFVFSVYQANTQKLIALSSQGSAIWGRTIDQLGFAFQAGDHYMVFNPKTKKLSLFNQKGLVKVRVLSNFNMPEGDGLPTAKKTVEGNLYVDLLTSQYILDAKTLASIHEFNGIQGSILDFRENSVLVYDWNEDRISMHLLK